MGVRNYGKGANRTNKLTKERGFFGSKFGPAAPAVSISPDTVALETPPATGFALTYASYAASRKRLGQTPLPPLDWIKRLKRRPAKEEAPQQ